MSEKELEEKKGLSNKAKGIIAGGAAAGIAAIVGVVSVVSLTGSKGEAEPTTYSVSISSELEGFEDTNLTINKGAKIKDLITMITAPVPGYRVEGFYKDILCTERYDDEEFVTENTKIYINFAVLTFTVRAFENNSSTEPIEVLDDVQYMHKANLKTPTKNPDKLAKEYEFMGWVDIRGNAVDIHHITEDLDVYATFRVKEYNYYKVAEIPSQVTITKGSGEQIEDVTTNTSLKCGERIKITYAVTEGYKKTEFSIIGASKVEGTEDWYEVTGEGEIKVTYAEEKLAFVVGNLQNGVKLTDAEGNEVSGFLYGDLIKVIITPTEGYHVTDIEIEGLFPAEGFTGTEFEYTVRGDVSVSFEEEINTVTVKYYDYDGSLLSSEIVSHGGSITTANPTRAIDERIGHYEFTGWVNKDNEEPATLTNMQILEHDLVIEVQATYTLNYVEYGLVVQEGVTVSVKRGDTILSETPNTLHFGDELTLSYTEREGYNYSLKVNGEEKANGSTYVVTNATTIEFSESIRTFELEITDENVKVTKLDGTPVNSGDILEYFEELTITVNNKTGYHVTAVYVNGTEISNGGTYVVKGELNITYSEAINTYSVTVPSGVTVRYNSTNYTSDFTAEYGKTITVTYSLSAGYHLNTFKINGTNQNNNGVSLTITGETNIEFSQTANTATYNFYSDGRLISTTTASTGGNVSRPSNPSKINGDIDYTYTFVGWMTTNGGTTEAIFNNIIVTNNNDTINVYAKFDSVYNYAYLDFALASDGNSYEVTGLNVNVTDVYIPATYNNKKVVGIKSNSFSNRTINSVNISNGITKIGDVAFGGCRNLTTITIPSSVTEIGNSAFSGCTNLKTVIIESAEIYTLATDNDFSIVGGLLSAATTVRVPKSIADSVSNTYLEGYVKTEDGNYYVFDLTQEIEIIDYCTYTYLSSTDSYAVSGISDKTATNIVIPSKHEGKPVTSIADRAFYYASNITSITIPDTITSIGNNAFFCCRNLTSVTIPDSVTSIGNSAFQTCSNLTTVKLGNGLKTIGYSAFIYCGKLTSITIPNSVTTIGNGVFSNCTSLTTLNIPSSVISFDGNPAGGCTSLTAINVDSNNTKYCSVNGVLFDKNMTNIFGYPAGKTATSYSIPTSVTTINNSAFSGCSSLVSITIPSGVTLIKSSAFNKCSGLKEIVIPDSVTSIGSSAFSSCSSLQRVTIGTGVTFIDTNAFYNCTSLVSVEFKDTNNWKVYEMFGSNEGTSVDVSNTSTNVTNLKSTYVSKRWRKE